MALSRRDFLSTITSAGAAIALERLVEAQAAPEPSGRLVRVMPLGRLDHRPTPPFHVLLGSGLDARQFTDLAAIRPDHLITPTQHFFIRTAHPSRLPPADRWQIALRGATDQRPLTATALRERAKPMGTHILECSGNSDPANFGLLSAATWTGVPIGEVLRSIAPSRDRWWVRLSGLDDEGPSETSVPGAAWIFANEDLERQGAFLAVGMNDELLTPNHGAPVRLVVPNYYGCCCVKWLNRIEVVPDDEPPTTQMREFASRTHQSGVPQLARDYLAPSIDLAAMPIRVEQWARGENTFYRVIGIRWGGTTPRPPLTIRFKHTDRFAPVDDVPASERTTSWSLWYHTWRPPAPGRYQIALAVSAPAIRTRRLDLFFYTREVQIDAV